MGGHQQPVYPPGYIDQSAADLVLRLYDHHPPTSAMSVLCEGEFANEGLQVRAFVIGASHAVFVTVGELKMAEVFSCAEVPGSTPVLERTLPEIQGDGPGFTTDVSGLHHSFSQEVRRIDAEGGTPEAVKGYVGIGGKDRLLCEDGKVCLHYLFPAAPGSPLTPYTSVSVCLHLVPDKSVLDIRSAHCYPHETQVVLTQSAFAIASVNAVLATL